MTDSPSPSLVPGQLLEGDFGRYEVSRRLDSGGMGTVFVGRDLNLDRDVVIKVPHLGKGSEDEREAIRRRFAREIDKLIRNPYPHICRIHARGEIDGVPFCILDWLSGGSLKDRLDTLDGAQTLEDALGWARPVAKALDALHAAKIVHRDVKPANILFDEHGYAFLGDFGVAKSLEHDMQDDVKITTTGTAVGSAAYMAPEQLKGQDVDGAADQYALASTLYEALVGHAPFLEESKSAYQVILAKASTSPVSANECNQNVSTFVSNALSQAMRVIPIERFASCTALLDALTEASMAGTRPSSSPLEPSGATTLEVAKKRRAWLWTLPMLALLGLFVAHLGGLFDPNTIVDKSSATSAPALPRPIEGLTARQVDEARRLGVPVQFTNELGMQFVLIPPGEFLMGSTPEEQRAALASVSKKFKDMTSVGPDWFTPESPQHRVVIARAFYMQVHETTQVQWKHYEPGYHATEVSLKGVKIDMSGDDDPAVWIRFRDIVGTPSTSGFIKWLTSRADPDKPERVAYALPTEKQWEYACRAGTMNVYWWGDGSGETFANTGDRETYRKVEMPHEALWPSDGYIGLSPIGSFRPNPWGLHDMLGNVSEWCSDRFERTAYASDPVAVPEGPRRNNTGMRNAPRVLRGGSWLDIPAEVRCAYRSKSLPGQRNRTVGFRLVGVIEAD